MILIVQKPQSPGPSQHVKPRGDSGINLPSDSEAYLTPAGSPQRNEETKYPVVQGMIKGLEAYWEELRITYYNEHPEISPQDDLDLTPTTIKKHVEAQMKLFGKTYKMMDIYFEGFSQLTELQKVRLHSEHDIKGHNAYEY
uniref:Mortality factor 4-like protein 1 n=1 Tax=Bursaphelenchus xylophilus TaxID=6326 RepID=A0A1I7SHD4_BURXY